MWQEIVTFFREFSFAAYSQVWVDKYPFLAYLGNQYVVSLLIIIAAAILAKLLIFIFKNYLEKFAANTETELDDMILDKVKKPFFYLILAQGLKLALFNLNVNITITQIVNTLMALVFVFILARGVEVVIEVWGKTFAKKTKTQLDEVLLPLFHKFSKIIFFVIAVMWGLRIWGIDIAPYLAGLGIGGLVIGLALQDSLKNILGGISLILDETFKVGEKIKLESGEVGEIVDIGLRSTKMRTYDNELINVPNGYLANTTIQNFTKPSPKIRVVVPFGVEYGSDVAKVKKLVLTEAKKIKDILDKPEVGVQFYEMADSSLNFKLMFWVKDWRDAHAKKLEATEMIYNLLNKHKIGIPFPTQTVYLEK